MAERDRTEALLQELLSQLKTPFPAAGAKLTAPTTHGVYVIRDAAGRVLHVGRTLRAREGLRQRLKGHLHGGSSFVREHFSGDGSLLRDACTYQFLAVDDARARALLENCAIWWLCPEHLGLGG